MYGRVNPLSGEVKVFPAPRGPGSYGISTTPAGHVYYASLAGSYVGKINLETGSVSVLNPPTVGQGSRRVWPDSKERIWVSEWNAGKLGMYNPATGQWLEWQPPGENPRPYAVYVDSEDTVWLSDFGSNSLVSFNPVTQLFTTFVIPSANASVRQLLGRPGEVWGAESGTDKLVVIRKRR